MGDTRRFRLKRRVSKIEDRLDEIEETVNALAVNLDGLEEYTKRR